MGDDKRIAIVTGANIGLGYETAVDLCKEGFTVVFACRNEHKAKSAIEDLKSEMEYASTDFIQLDLSKLSSVDSFCKEFLNTYDRLDLLINNAGIMMPPYNKTEDGFESQMGVNYFSHFVLTGKLLNILESTPKSRVVTLSSIAHKRAHINFDDINSETKYSASDAYGQSKLACLIFSYELDRRLKNNNYQTESLAAHPGISVTNLAQNLPSFATSLFKVLGPILFQTAEKGALPTLRAALDENANGGEYYGPSGWKEMKGKAVKVSSNKESEDLEVAEKLWNISEELTGFKFKF